MIKDILITGANGFIGSHVTYNLIREGFNVSAIVRESSDLWRLRGIEDKINFIDLSKYPIDKIFDNNVDAIIHLASVYKKSHKNEDIGNLIESNLIFPSQLLDTAANKGVRFFVNTGTYFRYHPASFIFSENSTVYPRNFYAATKVGFESILDYYALQGKLAAVTLVLFSPYGEKDHLDKVIPYIINGALKDDVVRLSNGLQRLDFTYVEDIAEAYIKAIRYLDKNNSGHELINISSGRSYSIRDVVSIVEEIMGKRIRVEWGNDLDNSDTVASISKAKELLNWIPRYSMRDGLARTVRYYGGQI